MGVDAARSENSSGHQEVDSSRPGTTTSGILFLFLQIRNSLYHLASGRKDYGH